MEVLGWQNTHLQGYVLLQFTFLHMKFSVSCDTEREKG